MAAVTAYTKTPAERKRYLLDYSDWLDTGEKVLSVVFSTTSATLLCDESLVDGTGTQLTYFVLGGVDGERTELLITATTDGGQIKQDAIAFVVQVV